jgi:hypothetical protein
VARAKHHGHGLPLGFVSKQQWRWAYATHQTFAHKDSEKVVATRGKKTGYRTLPKRTAVRKKI